MPVAMKCRLSTSGRKNCGPIETYPGALRLSHWQGYMATGGSGTAVGSALTGLQTGSSGC